MTHCPRYTSADARYGKPLVFFQSTWDVVTSPVPPGFNAKALFFPSDMNLRMVSHSSRVIFPSWFKSWLSKKPWKAFSASSRDRAPSPSLSRSLSMASNDGICISLSSGPLEPPPAKNNVPLAVIGEAQHADGIPFKNHFSAPLFKSYPIIRSWPPATISLPAFVSQMMGVQHEAGADRFCSY